jgi:putative ABC transport system ATP-binding protein
MLKLNNITKIFNQHLTPEDVKVALDDISLEIKDGDFVTVIGGNGSGKTTLLNIITGVLKPNQGRIIINDKDITKMPDYKRAQYFGIVFQDPMLGTAANMSLEENLSIAYRRAQKKGLRWGFSKENTRLFKEKLAMLNLGLEKRLNQRINLLSGGQRQAVTLLMATLNRPKVLLLDEHTAALDPKTARTVMDITNDLVTTNHLTTIMITHNMKDALKYGNRILMLNNGKIVFDASGEEKKRLTIEDLLRKFDDQVDFSDQMLLG